MFFPFPGRAHRRACATKRAERNQRIEDLDPVYKYALTATDISILNQSVSALVASVQGGRLKPTNILVAFGKKALHAHEETNCLTEIMIASAEAWARGCNKKGPLAGVPVSLKDTVGVAGWDACIGYSAWVGRPSTKDAAIVRLLRDAGAVPYVKTNIPITLLSYESVSDVFGRTTNPHNKGYSAGGSSGGEAALLAYGGSRIGIGTDVAGSVRVPAHYSGIYSIKASVGRFVRMGSSTSIPGQEGVPATYSPMARTLEDLDTFWQAVMSMEPWKYDPFCLPIPWRKVDMKNKTLKWGVLWDDGVVAPSPACQRALQTVVDVLTRNGHSITAINPPSPYEALQIGAQLILADAGKTVNQPIQYGEFCDAGIRQAMIMFKLPRWVKRIYAWYLRHIRGDEIYAGLVENFHEQRITEFWPLVARREDYKNRWFEMWEREELDFVLTVPNAFPACPHGGMKNGFKACGYAFLFNILDYAAGVLPVTRVDARLDKLHYFKARNAIEKGSYKSYDSGAMAGLPVGVQIVGRRLEEEKVMEGMKIVESLLRQDGVVYEQLEM